MSKPKDADPPAPQEILPPVPGAKPGKGSKEAEPEKDLELESLMSEIESDLREQELRKIWERYNKPIIALCVAIVIGVAGAQLWRQHQTEQRLDLAARFEAAQADLAQGKTDDAMAVFADVAKARGEGFAALAELNRAAILAQKNDIDGAVAIYKTIAADAKADQVFRDLAVILQVQHTLDRDDPKVLEPMLAPLTNPGNPYHNVANELSALLAAKQGDYARASQLATQVLTDPATPQYMRLRMQDLAGYYKAQAALPKPATPAAPAEAPKP